MTRMEHLGIHHYVVNANEQTALRNQGWTLENVLFSCSGF